MRKPDEKFYLKWNNYQPNLAAGFQDLLQEEMMVDVTLAVGGKCLQAHKIVLSVCSPYFKDLFKNNPCRHPIVILKDIAYRTMVNMLDFMYRGETEVREKDFGAFLQLAEILKVRGLAGSEDNDESEPVNGNKKYDSDSETDIGNGDVDEEKDDESEPSSPSQDLKNFVSQPSKNTETSNVNEDYDSSSIKGPKRKKRKLSSVEDSDETAIPSCSQAFALAPVKEEILSSDEMRLIYDNNNETDIDLNASQTATQDNNEFKDLKLDDILDDSGNTSQEPDFDIKSFINPEDTETDEVLEMLYSVTELKGKIVLYKGFKYRFHMLYVDGSKTWRCTMRNRKCPAELEVHPALGVIAIGEHTHPAPKT